MYVYTGHWSTFWCLLPSGHLKVATFSRAAWVRLLSQRSSTSGWPSDVRMPSWYLRFKLKHFWLVILRNSTVAGHFSFLIYHPVYLWKDLGSLAAQVSKKSWRWSRSKTGVLPWLMRIFNLFQCFHSWDGWFVFFAYSCFPGGLLFEHIWCWCNNLGDSWDSQNCWWFPSGRGWVSSGIPGESV